MVILRRLPVLFAVAALALIFVYGSPSADRTASSDSSALMQQLAQLQKARDHAAPGSAAHSKYSHKINRIRAALDGRPLQESPDLFAKMLYDRTVPADRSFPDYPPSYRVHELDRAKAAKGAAGTPLPWISRGPGNVAGRARAIVVDPDDATNNTWYFGSVGGGVWKTTDAG